MCDLCYQVGDLVYPEQDPHYQVFTVLSRGTLDEWGNSISGYALGKLVREVPATPELLGCTSCGWRRSGCTMVELCQDTIPYYTGGWRGNHLNMRAVEATPRIT